MFTGAATAKQRLLDAHDLYGDVELDKNTVFVEMRDAVRSCGAKMGVRCLIDGGHLCLIVIHFISYIRLHRSKSPSEASIF
jgi:hypothetical protein